MPASDSSAVSVVVLGKVQARPPARLEDYLGDEEEVNGALRRLTPVATAWASAPVGA